MESKNTSQLPVDFIKSFNNIIKFYLLPYFLVNLFSVENLTNLAQTKINLIRVNIAMAKLTRMEVLGFWEREKRNENREEE